MKRRGEARRLDVARQIVKVGELYRQAFEFERELHPPRAVERAFAETERAFSDDDFDRAEHLVRVLTFMIEREAPKFAADPRRYIETRRELQP